MRVDTRQRELELVLQPDIARRLGITRQRIHQLSQDDDFPAPVGRLGRSRVWDWAVIETWARAHDRPIVARDE